MRIRHVVFRRCLAASTIAAAHLTGVSYGQGTLDQQNAPPGTGAATNIQPVNTVSQVFVPSLPQLVAVEVGLKTGNPGRGGDKLTLSILGPGGTKLVSSAANIPEGYEGFWRFSFPGLGITVTPAQPLTILLEDTGKVVFWWKYEGGNTYPAGQAYFYGSVFKDNDFYFRTYGTAALSCGIPPYTPGYWNDASTGGAVQWNNNCYNYGNNKRTDTYAQPGRAAAAQSAWPVTCASILAAASADGLEPVPASGTCPTGKDKIAFAVAPCVGGSCAGNDYHWYRLGSDGMWSHKPGGGPATNLDESHHTIGNPEAANRCGTFCYSQFCGYLCSCSDTQQGQGHEIIN